MKDETGVAISAEEIEDELNIFDQLLALRGKVFLARILAPFFTRPLDVYYMPLEEGEHQGRAPPEDFLVVSDEQKIEYLNALAEDKVWLMIEKANKSGRVPKKNQMSRKQFDEIKRHYPDIYNEIIGFISGRMARFADFFTSGRPEAE